MAVTAFAVSSAEAQNSYSAHSDNGSLFGNQSGSTVEKSYSGHWGLGLRLGIAENNPKDIEEIYDHAFDYGYSEKELTKGHGVYGAEVLYEFDLSEETNKFGLKLGVEGYGENELSLDWGDEKLTETTYAIPLTAYYKIDYGIKNWSWFAGAGVTYIRSELEVKQTGYPTETFSKSKVFPHITAGAEYRFSKLFALGLDVKYNIDAKVKKDGDLLSDRSGIGAAITGRFYF